MKFHDIMSEADGWAHHVDGVRHALFPTRDLALAAASRLAERDVLKGTGVSVRYQNADGTMRLVRQNAKTISGAGRHAANA